ncbi:unnamed protein product, partial [Pylaiella littoralis]
RNLRGYIGSRHQLLATLVSATECHYTQTHTHTQGRLFRSSQQMGPSSWFYTFDKANKQIGPASRGSISSNESNQARQGSGRICSPPSVVKNRSQNPPGGKTKFKCFPAENMAGGRGFIILASLHKPCCPKKKESEGDECTVVEPTNHMRLKDNTEKSLKHTEKERPHRQDSPSGCLHGVPIHKEGRDKKNIRMLAD